MLGADNIEKFNVTYSNYNILFFPEYLLSSVFSKAHNWKQSPYTFLQFDHPVIGF